MKRFLQICRLWVAGTLLVGNPIRVRGLPAGFEDEAVVQMNQVVDIAFAGNIMLAVTKDGKLNSFDLADPEATSHLAADFTDLVCTNGERGYVRMARSYCAQCMCRVLETDAARLVCCASLFYPLQPEYGRRPPTVCRKSLGLSLLHVQPRQPELSRGPDRWAFQSVHAIRDERRLDARYDVRTGPVSEHASS